MTDRQITISIGKSRKEMNWKKSVLSVSALYERLKTPIRGTETLAEYMAMKKPQQDELKDIAGGFVGGELNGPRRKSNNIIGKDLITIDMDNLAAGGTALVIDRLNSLNCNYCVYSTRKHTPNRPRLRIIIPFDRTVTPDEYEPCARRVAQQIGMDMIDPTTFEIARLFYYPTCCSDSEYVFEVKDAPFISADFLLSTYTDWHDYRSWPQAPNTVSYQKLANKQGDPTAKNGVVGAFCRTYDIYSALEKFLPGIYEPVDSEDNRYTYLGGSTTGGAIIYDDGKFLFSHHSTDPCGGRLVNAFDLVRLHKFNEKDDEASLDTPVVKLPSYTAMLELARNDEAVSKLIIQEEFSDVIQSEVENEEAFVELSKYDGKTLTIDILKLALAAFGVTIRNNLITGRAEISGMPSEFSSENAINTLPVFLMDRLKKIGIKSVSKNAVDDYLSAICDSYRYNPVVDMFNGISWDNHTRYPELYRVLGVDATGFDATLIKKWMIQCVALAHNEFERQDNADGVLTLQGNQGVGKTLFFRKLAVQKDWFIEGASIDFKNKDTIILATSGWISELGELDSTLKRDQSNLKAFITAASDRIRAPYAREATHRPRRTSFCATVNPGQFLRDETGDRRFWVVSVDNIALDTLKGLSKEWFTQLWAETYLLWQKHPQSFRLTQTEQNTLNERNASFRETKPGEEEIRQAFDFSLPQDQWTEWSASKLQMYLVLSHKYNTRQIGTALAKIQREETAITSKFLKGIKVYRLPIAKTAMPDYNVQN